MTRTPASELTAPAARNWRAAVAPPVIVLATRLIYTMGWVPLTVDYVSKLVLLAAITTALAIGVSLAIGTVTNNHPAAGLAVAIGLYIAGSSRWFVNTAAVLPQGAALPVFFFVVLAIAVLTFRVYSPAWRFLTLAGVVILSMSGAIAAPWKAVTPQEISPQIRADATTSPEHDLILIVLDAYGRSDVLSHFGYDNTPFLSRLEADGLTVLGEARSNYSTTAVSVSSMLAQEYPVTETLGLTPEERHAIPDIIGGNNVSVLDLQTSGYEFTMIENPWSESRCAANVDHCVEKQFLENVAMFWIQGDSFGGFANHIVVHPFPASVDNSFDALRAVEFGQEPKAVFVHIASPHWPARLNADCSPTAKKPSGNFLDQTQCVEQYVSTAIGHLPDDAIVVLVSDHGPNIVAVESTPPREWTDEEIAIRMSVLGAVRFPAHCELPSENSTLINIWIDAVACATGVPIERVADRQFVLQPRIDQTVPVREVDSNEASLQD